MEQVHEKQIPIWFFIGAIVAIYGVLILGVGIYHWISPPPVAERVMLWDKHADIWWGALLLALGLFYVIKFKPETKD